MWAARGVLLSGAGGCTRYMRAWPSKRRLPSTLCVSPARSSLAAMTTNSTQADRSHAKYACCQPAAAGDCATCARLLAQGADVNRSSPAMCARRGRTHLRTVGAALLRKVRAAVWTNSAGGRLCALRCSTATQQWSSF